MRKVTAASTMASVVLLWIAAGCVGGGGPTRLPGDGAGAPFSLEEAQRRLTEATGRKWAVQEFKGWGKVLRWSDLWRADGPELYYILPFPLDAEGQQQVGLFQNRICSLSLMILGANDQCVALSYVRHNPSLSSAIKQTLGLSEPGVTVRQCRARYREASRTATSLEGAGQ